MNTYCTQCLLPVLKIRFVNQPDQHNISVKCYKIKPYCMFQDYFTRPQYNDHVSMWYKYS